SPIVTIREPAMETVEKPLPIPSAFQASGGPSVGHSFNNPVSGEWPSRFGPRHCGQSAPIVWPAGVSKKPEYKITQKSDNRDIYVLTAINRVYSKSKGQIARLTGPEPPDK